MFYLLVVVLLIIHVLSVKMSYRIQNSLGGLSEVPPLFQGLAVMSAVRGIWYMLIFLALNFGVTVLLAKTNLIDVVEYRNVGIIYWVILLGLVILNCITYLFVNLEKVRTNLVRYLLILLTIYHVLTIFYILFVGFVIY